MHLSLVYTCAVAECDPYIADEHQIPIYIGTYTLQMRRNSMKVLDLFEFGIQCYSQAIEIWCVLVTGVETEKFHNSSAWLCLFFFLSACACMVPVHVIMPEYSLDEFFFVSPIQVLLIQSVEPPCTAFPFTLSLSTLWR